MKILYIIRGLPGSGKTCLAEKLAPLHNYAADQYFLTENGYEFDGRKIGEAHALCKERTSQCMQAGVPCIAVHNTFTTNKEMLPYLQMAQTHGYTPCVIHMQSHMGDNGHNVPEETIEKMNRRFEKLSDAWQKMSHAWQK